MQQESPKCEKCKRYLSTKKVHKCPKKKKRYIADINIKKIDELDRYISILENGCHKWIINSNVIIIYENGQYSPQRLMASQLYASYAYCVNCHYPICECPDRIVYDLGFKCGFDECLNKEHFILIDFDDLCKDYDNGMDLDLLVKKYGQPKSTLQSWIKYRD